MFSYFRLFCNLANMYKHMYTLYIVSDKIQNLSAQGVHDLEGK